MAIYIIRHTTPEVQKGICYGQTNLDVSATFNEEYLKIHEQITYDSATKIYSSPLIRCQKLASTFKNSVQYDERLMELNFGSWEMKAWDAIAPEEINPWMKNFVTSKVPNGESYEILQERVIRFYEEILLPTKENAIVVAHAGSIRALLAHLENIPLQDSFSIQLNYGHVLHLDNRDTTLTISKGLIIK